MKLVYFDQRPRWLLTKTCQKPPHSQPFLAGFFLQLARNANTRRPLEFLHSFLASSSSRVSFHHRIGISPCFSCQRNGKTNPATFDQMHIGLIYVVSSFFLLYTRIHRKSILQKINKKSLRIFAWGAVKKRASRLESSLLVLLSVNVLIYTGHPINLLHDE